MGINNFTKNVLCIHQGAEMYGSDRSFLSAVQGIVGSYGKQNVTIILPSCGGLAGQIKKTGAVLKYYPYGILRKKNLSNIYKMIIEIWRSTLYYYRLYKKFDLVYINTIVMFSPLIAAIFFRFSNKKIVCHVREIPPRFLAIIFSILFKIGDVKQIYNSSATSEVFGNHGAVIHNGIESNTCYGKNFPTKRNFSSNESGPINLLMIGRINSWKGQDFFIETLSSLDPCLLARLRIRIVGSPFKGYEYLEEYLKSMVGEKLANIVEFFSFCEDPSCHYLWADFVVVPSVKPEPFGRVAVEAFSYSVPVLAAEHGGLVEIIRPDVDGFLFKPVDKSSLAECLGRIFQMSPAQYIEMACQARLRYLNRFSADTYRKNIVDYLSSI